MYKNTQIFYATIILGYIISISSISSTTNQNQLTKHQLKKISENITNQLLQTPIPPEQYQKPITHNNTVKKSISKDLDPDPNRPKNIPITILGQSLGYIYMILWAIGGYFLIREPLVSKSSSCLSKNFVLVHLTGFSMLLFYDAYGFFGNSSYKNEIHISDLMLSFIITTCYAIAFIEVRVIPGDPINKFSSTVIVICTLCIQISFSLIFATNLEITALFNGIIKSCFGLIACIPQYILIYRMKSTQGFSIVCQILDITGCLCAILQIKIDYYANGDGIGFWRELNWGKFLMNQVSIAGVSVFLCQARYYKYYYKSGKLEVPDIDESQNESWIPWSRMGSDLILRKMRGNLGIVRYVKSEENLRGLDCEYDTLLMDSRKGCNSDF